MGEVEERPAELRYLLGSDRTVVEPRDGPTARADPVAVLVMRVDLSGVLSHPSVTSASVA
jgi:hypothetical protein